MKRIGGLLSNAPAVVLFVWHSIVGHPSHMVKKVPGFTRHYFECECGMWDLPDPMRKSTPEAYRELNEENGNA